MICFKSLTPKIHTQTIKLDSYEMQLQQKQFAVVILEYHKILATWEASKNDCSGDQTWT